MLWLEKTKVDANLLVVKCNYWDEFWIASSICRSQRYMLPTVFRVD